MFWRSTGNENLTAISPDWAYNIISCFSEQNRKFIYPSTRIPFPFELSFHPVDADSGVSSHLNFSDPEHCL